MQDERELAAVGPAHGAADGQEVQRAVEVAPGRSAKSRAAIAGVKRS